MFSDLILLFQPTFYGDGEKTDEINHTSQDNGATVKQ